MKKLKKLRKLTNKVINTLQDLSLPINKKLKLIDKWYPGPQGLTDEEILMYSDFNSDHDYQFFIAFMRKTNAKLKKSNPEMSGLIDSDTTIGAL